MNKNIIRQSKKYVYAAMVFAVIYAVALLFINLKLADFLSGFQLNVEISLIRAIVNAVWICLALLPVGFLIGRFLKLYDLKDVEPTKCTVADIVALRHKTKNSRYNVCPLLKTPDGELVFSYNPHNLSTYMLAYGKTDQSPYRANIFRKDGSCLKIGDTVEVYIASTIHVSADIDDSMLRLNGVEYSFENYSDKYDIQTFNKVSFFKGFIDIEN